MNKIAVVILNWNGADMLRRFLPSVLAHSAAPGVVVCVADNGSTDNSLKVLREEFPSVHLILLGENHGFADGYNLALREVDAEYVVLLNSDVEVTADWLLPMQSYMDAHPEVAACQPKLRSWHNRNLFEYAGACGGFIDRYGYPFCRGRIMSHVEEDCAQYDTQLPIFWATGAALFIRRGRFRWSLLCSHGRDRPLLAFACSRMGHCVCASKRGLSCGGSNAEEGESAQDLP